ncbi:DNA polymerase [Lactiplantibacillus plantarum]|uniref:DNA polymerase n=1 Tax=Lactiplantibacillus plantarum TaxID=1590 RepID=UPI001C9CEB25|nr:DNA polymerase [Lactiplantibacillus plantarum]
MIRTLTNKSIHLGFGGWSQDGVRPWIIARQQTLTELQEYLGIGIYSVENNVQIRNYARLKGIDIASLSMSWLSEHRHDDRVIELLLNKINYDNLLRRFRDTLADNQTDDGIVRLSGEWDPYSSYSGRFTAHEMAMTALPNAMRKYFVAPNVHGKPGVYVSFDANQMELRLLAGAAHCERLLDQFERGIDVHKLFAAKLFEVDVTLVTSVMRKLAKTLIYAMLYGAGGNRLLTIVNKSGLRIQRKPMEVLHYLYPEVEVLLRKFRCSSNIYYAMKPTRLKARIGQEWLSPSTRQNLPVQSATSLLMKQTMIELGNKCHIVNVIHDEFIFLCEINQIQATQLVVMQAIADAARVLDLSLPLTNIFKIQKLGGIKHDKN